MLRTLRTLSALALILSGCAAADAQRGPDKKPETSSLAPAVHDASPDGPKTPLDRLSRDQIKAVLPSGLAWLFRRVWPEDVVTEGKFIGWRLTAIPEEWQGIDLRPEDVVTRVNGKTLETPEQAWDAWASLATAAELRIAYERNGQGRELVLPIEGPPAPELLASLTSDTPPPRKPSPRKGTIVIESRDPAGDPEDDPYKKPGSK